MIFEVIYKPTGKFPTDDDIAEVIETIDERIDNDIDCAEDADDLIMWVQENCGYYPGGLKEDDYLIDQKGQLFFYDPNADDYVRQNNRTAMPCRLPAEFFEVRLK